MSTVCLAHIIGIRNMCISKPWDRLAALDPVGGLRAGNVLQLNFCEWALHD